MLSSCINESESPLDVLSRAASMVEQALLQPTDHDQPSSTSTTRNKINNGCERSPSFKERHPKFRKSGTPDYLLAAQFHRQNSSSASTDQEWNQASASSSGSSPHNMNVDAAARLSPDPSQMISQQQPEGSNPAQPTATDEGPLDMSIKKRPHSNSPPPYRFTPLLASAFPNPPPYFSPGPVSPPNLVERLPPPPSYEASTKFLLGASGLSTSVPQPRKLIPDNSLEDTRPIREITIITADSSADPLLDEHFRRSLGANYQSLFKKDSSSKSTSSAVTSPTATSSVSPAPSSSTVTSPSTVTSSIVTSSIKSRSPSLSPDSSSMKVDDLVVKAFKDDMDMECYTVEDHFAKALGDTWVRLQAEAEKAKAAARDKSQSSSGGSNSNIIARL